VNSHLCKSQNYTVFTRDKSPFTQMYSQPAMKYRDTVVYAWKIQSSFHKLPVQFFVITALTGKGSLNTISTLVFII
jgi:hypothetical protein